ncbi:hypothetical protein BB561_003792 [Smittium simulii]|uniref:Uncharacterized protein n=1 Tax=Smittium simulii TaxID=133385 RepID=A0A2T9YJK8_9FUNG|nr:hypothetical protein BB561_003792 [Smittium simulii]
MSNSIKGNNKFESSQKIIIPKEIHYDTQNEINDIQSNIYTKSYIYDSIANNYLNRFKKHTNLFELIYKCNSDFEKIKNHQYSLLDALKKTIKNNDDYDFKKFFKAREIMDHYDFNKYNISECLYVAMKHVIDDLFKNKENMFCASMLDKLIKRFDDYSSNMEKEISITKIFTCLGTECRNKVKNIINNISYTLNQQRKFN